MVLNQTWNPTEGTYNVEGNGEYERWIKEGKKNLRLIKRDFIL